MVYFKLNMRKATELREIIWNLQEMNGLDRSLFSSESSDYPFEIVWTQSKTTRIFFQALLDLLKIEYTTSETKPPSMFDNMFGNRNEKETE